MTTAMNLPKYEIIKHDEKTGQLLFKVFLPSDLVFFQGHFPGYPILPGVAQIYIAEQLATRYLSAFGDFTGMKQLKFSRPITPVAFLFLALDLNPEKMSLSFQFYDEVEVKSKGLISFMKKP